MTTSRQCGDCTVCCTLLEVAALKKPMGIECAHACNKGCNTYNTRPSECRKFRCGWLSGVGASGQRPDKSGYMIHISSVQNVGTIPIVTEFKRTSITPDIEQMLRQRFKLTLIKRHNGTDDLIGSVEDLAVIKPRMNHEGLRVNANT